MTFRHPSTSSPLPLFLLLSIGIHIIGAGLFFVFSVNIPKPQNIQITLQNISTPIRSTSPTSENKPIKQTTPPPVSVAKPKPNPIKKEKVVKKVASQIKKSTPKVAPVVNKAKPIPKKVVPVPVPQPAPPTKPAPIQEKKVEQATPTPAPKDFSQELDQLLTKKNTIEEKKDFLADAKWGGTPRKTLSFPNLTASIPQHYKSRGYGFSITARITFSHQGWVSSVELVQGSGDPRIDGVFRTELRKIRIEPSKNTQYDTIIKTFKVSVK